MQWPYGAWKIVTIDLRGGMQWPHGAWKIVTGRRGAVCC